MIKVDVKVKYDKYLGIEGVLELRCRQRVGILE
jgi:hypothetical protein